MSNESTTPANPAQVTDADLDYGLKLIAEAIDAHFGDRDDAYKYEMGDTTIHDVWEAYDALTAAIGASRSSEPEFETAPDNGTPAEVLAYVLECARRWVPEARIIGNARAGDIERAIAAIGAGGQAVAWMRKWAFDGIDVMALPKKDRPAGWMLHEVTHHQCLPDDVPLFLHPAPSDKWPDWLHAIVDRTNEVADRLDMSSEQAHAYAALSALAHPVQPGWRDMESAPKDGTWIIAYRPNKNGGYLDRVVIVRWDDEVSAWVWPDQPFDVYEDDYTERLAAHGLGDHIDPFEDNAFTHWMPLPVAPQPKGEA